MSRELPLALEDRRCRPRGLDNPLRRALAPARHDAARLGVAPGQAVADLGAGVGFYVPELLARVGPQGWVYAIDPDAANVERLRDRAAGDARLVVLERSAAHLPEIPSESVDRALLSLVLCCLVDKSGVLSEAFRILKPGGRALVTYPRGLDLRGGPRRRLRVTPELWARLVRERPWSPQPMRSGILVVRHLLAKPGRPGAG